MDRQLAGGAGEEEKLAALEKKRINVNAHILREINEFRKLDDGTRIWKKRGRKVFYYWHLINTKCLFPPED